MCVHMCAACACVYVPVYVCVMCVLTCTAFFHLILIKPSPLLLSSLSFPFGHLSCPILLTVHVVPTLVPSSRGAHGTQAEAQHSIPMAAGLVQRWTWAPSQTKPRNFSLKRPR